MSCVFDVIAHTKKWRNSRVTMYDLSHRAVFEIDLRCGWTGNAYRLLTYCKLVENQMWDLENPTVPHTAHADHQ